MGRKVATAAVAACALLASCGGDGRATGEEPSGELLVFAAASLTDAFEELAADFEDAHPGVTVTLNLAGSGSLREQILSGAPADVFASASTADVDQVEETGAAEGSPRVFARNRLEIAVPAGNPAGITGLEDFADPGLLIGLCAEDVPCGRYGRRALESAGITPSLDTEEPDVRSLLTKVEAGELDAGIVYATDVAAAADTVQGIAIPEEHQVEVVYPVVVLAAAPNPETAAAFVAFVLSAEGLDVLSSYGFLAP